MVAGDGGGIVSERSYDWAADVKVGGDPTPISIVFKDGDFSATGGEMADMVLMSFETRVDENLDSWPVNPIIHGQMGEVYEKSLRAIPGVRVYGIDASYLDLSDSDDPI
jgi:hypothetical protein